MRRLPVLAAFLAALGAPAPALAQQKTDNESWDGGFGKKNERRGDVVLGFSPGLVLTSASGYPNEIDKLNQPQYQVDSGLAVGGGFEAWLGGALTDWFTFGLGGSYFNGSGSGTKLSGGAFLVRVETFPLYKLGGGWRDLAVFANFGAGGLVVSKGVEPAELRQAPTDLANEPDKRASAGFASIGGAGVAYELYRAWHFAFAPTAEYQLVTSQSLTAHQTLLGVRVVFYGGPG
jgi:hypothetical protein